MYTLWFECAGYSKQNQVYAGQIRSLSQQGLVVERLDLSFLHLLQLTLVVLIIDLLVVRDDLVQIDIRASENVMRRSTVQASGFLVSTERSNTNLPSA